MIELRAEREPAEGEEDEGDVRIHDRTTRMRSLQRHLVTSRPACRRRAASTVVPSKRMSVRPSIARSSDGDVGRDDVDQLLRQRFLLGERLRLAHGALRDGDVASALSARCVRMNAAASFSSFVFITSSIFSPRRTGCAAPVFVPGAIAAMSAASRMKKPADAARLPLGAT